MVVPRLEVGHADNAVEETWKVVAAKLRGLSGLDLDGVDLVNQALGSKGPLQLSDRMSAQGRNDHDGITNLLRGLAQAGRNVRAHRPSNTEAAETEIAALLLVASLCLDVSTRSATTMRIPNAEGRERSVTSLTSTRGAGLERRL